MRTLDRARFRGRVGKATDVALNKSKTSPAVKAGIIILIVAFVSAFMYSGIAGIVNLFQNANTTQTSQVATNTVDAINSRYQPGVTALKAVAASQPTSFSVQVNLANAYFDWAKELSTPAQSGSQLTTAAMVAATEQWAAARSAYENAIKLKPNDPPTMVDYSVATFYSGDTTTAVVTAVKVTKIAPTFGAAWLNLGIFYERLGNTANAVAAYQQYLKVSPTGDSAAFAKQQLSQLLKSSPTSATP